MIITHGWPGSIIEQLKIIDPLTNPTAHGGTAADAFDVVIPSLPGYGFSGKPTGDRLGSDPHRARVGRAHEAPRLQASSWRRAATGATRSRSRWRCWALRSSSASTPTCRPPCRPTSTRPPAPARRRPPASRPTRSTPTSSSPSSTSTAWATPARWRTARRRSTRSSDSPVGLAAWMLDHDAASMALIARVFDGQPEGLTRDDVLDNVTLYWLTKTASLVGPSLLGEQARVLRAEGRPHPGRRERLRRRALPGAEELDGEGVSEARLLQPARQGRPLRRVGAAGGSSSRICERRSSRCADQLATRRPRRHQKGLSP